MARRAGMTRMGKKVIHQMKIAVYFRAPTAEEFLRIKNSGGGYTDGRPELQHDLQMARVLKAITPKSLV
jgi:hypothetical protein